ncbi:VOC family protein [Hymenobacter terricola]|uniref:VOC family protein n=1 Tax=Hymenobacter terricola TaxID=2819236 RepID=UPI001B312059|nr:VOC family protein [Hymenobacter terricola]
MSTNSENGLQSLKLHNLAFTVSNLENAIQWYGDILGFKVVNRTTFPAIGATLAFIQKADVRLEMLQVSDGFRIDELFADAPNHLLPHGNKSLVLQVNDLHSATLELEEKGVTFAWKEVDLSGNGNFSTMIRDMDGNFINIFQSDLVEKLG